MSEILYDRQQRALGQEINNKIQELIVGVICEENLLICEVVKQLSLVGVKRIHLFMKNGFEPIKLTSITQYVEEQDINNVKKVDILITSNAEYANKYYDQTKVVFVNQKYIIHVKEPISIQKEEKNEPFYNDLLIANLFMYWLCNLISGQANSIKVNITDQIKTQKL